MAENEKKVAQGAEVKAPKPEKKKGKLKKAFLGLKSECGKIVWPTWKQVIKNTFIVLVIVVIFAIMIGVLDYAFANGFKALTQLFT